MLKVIFQGRRKKTQPKRATHPLKCTLKEFLSLIPSIVAFLFYSKPISDDGWKSEKGLEIRKTSL